MHGFRMRHESRGEFTVESDRVGEGTGVGQGTDLPERKETLMELMSRHGENPDYTWNRVRLDGECIRHWLVEGRRVRVPVVFLP